MNDRTYEEIKAVILANQQSQAAGTFDGLTSSEIAAWHRRMMFGENDEAFPSQDEWRFVVD